MCKITVTTEAETAYLSTPYNANFVAAIKRIGGARWDRDRRVWAIPAEAIDQAREIMRRVYGEDDRPSAEPSVSVKLTFSDRICEWRAPVTILGKTIASAWGRDSGARVGDDVAFVEGRPESGGSMKNWYSVVPAGCVVVLHNVPQAALQMELPEGVTAEVMQPATIDRAALEAERERLLARLAEIDQLLA